MKTGRIGIFWIVKDKIIVFSEALNTLKPVADYKDSNFSHIKKWREVQKRYPVFLNTPYEALNRGRITFNIKSEKYHLYVSKRIKLNQAIIHKIIKKFSLPLNKVIVEEDIHYTLPEDITEKDWE